MPPITVDGVAFTNPDYTAAAFRHLGPKVLVLQILATNPMLPRHELTKRVIMGSFEQLTVMMRARTIASGHCPESQRRVDNKMHQWQNHRYWKVQHALATGVVEPQEAAETSKPIGNKSLRKKCKKRSRKLGHDLPNIVAADLEGLRPAKLMQLLQQRNPSCPTRRFSRMMMMSTYRQLICCTYGKAVGSSRRRDMNLPYKKWIRRWRNDNYWHHQHSLDIGTGRSPDTPAMPTTTLTNHGGASDIAPGVESGTSSESDDKTEEASSDHESDSESGQTPNDGTTYRAQIVSGVVQEDSQLRSSLPSPSPLRLASQPEVESSSRVSVSSMRVQQEPPAVSHSPSPPISSPATPGASQPLLPHQVDIATQRAAMLVLGQAVSREQTPPMQHALPARPATHFIGDEMYHLPDSRMFFLHKINVKSFSVELLKINRGINMQKMTAEVLLECYRTFINRFFPMARSGLKANVLSCITNNSNQEFLDNHTDTLARLASQPAGTVPVTTSSTVAADPMPYVNDLNSDTDSDVEIIEVRIPRPTMSSRPTAMQQDDSAVVEDSNERKHRERKRRSQATDNTSAASQRTLAQPKRPPAQLLIDNKLYTMPEATQFPLRNLSVTSFSRALYNLNGHYHPRDLSHSLILKAYKSFIFSQYLEASFDDKIHACRQLNWPAPPKAEAEYLRNLNILERTHNKALTGRAPPSAIVEAEPAAPAQTERPRVGEEEDTSLSATPSPEPRRPKPSKVSVEAIHSDQDVEAPLVRKRKQRIEGEESHSRHKKKRRATEESGVGAGTPMLMSGALAFRPSPVPAALSAETTDGSAHKRRKKARNTREEAS